MKSPSVIAPARIARPPMTIMMTPMTPTTTVENAVIAETPVIDLRDVAEQPVDALGEDELFALLGGVGLDDPDAAERLVQPAGDLGVDLAALAEERPQAVEGERHRAAERGQRDERREREPPVQIEEDAERDHGGDDAAGELDEAGADEVADAFGVRHDARDQDAGLRRVEIADRQPGDVRLDRGGACR